MSYETLLNEYFLELEKKDLYTGVVLISQDGKPLFHKAYGYASRTWKIKNTLDTRFDTASVTKLFTAVAILQLIEKNLLSLETRVVETLGLTEGKISDKVNVYHLLTHSSGIGDDCEEENDERYEDLWKTKPNYSVRNTQDFLPQFIYKDPNFPPGEGCRYCNCGYVLLGLMLEKATGMSYRDYVKENIFLKSGMVHSDFLYMENVNELTAEGCDPIKNEAEKIVSWRKNIYSFPPIGSPDSGAYVTAADLDRFLWAIRSGSLLSPEMSKALFTPRVDYDICDDLDVRLSLIHI